MAEQIMWAVKRDDVIVPWTIRDCDEEEAFRLRNSWGLGMHELVRVKVTEVEGERAG